MNLGQAKNLLKNPNFVKWFGDSVVKDEMGNPLRVYHGTNKKFNVFKEGEGKEFKDRGIFFTDNRKVSDAFGGDENTIEAYLSMKNPLVVDAQGNHWLNIDFEGGKTNSDLLAGIARERGHDGVVLKNVKDPNPLIGNSYIVFNPTQIKSTANRGTFDPTNPNILKGATAIAAGSTLLPKDALAQKHKKMESDQALQDAYSPVDMVIAGATGGATMGLRAISALADPVINYAIDRMLGD
jgi:hypothetical protein